MDMEMKHNVPVQSLIDHIKTAIDVDPWAKEMAEDLLKKQEAVRCKDCAYALFKEGIQPGHVVCTKPFTERWQAVKPDNWFCADGLVKDNCSEFPNN